MISEERLEEFAAKYLKKGDIAAVGSDSLGERMLRKIALKSHEHALGVQVVPTSTHIASLCHSLHLPLANINDHEIDLAFESARVIDKFFNFVKQDTHSLVRDKMIAQSAGELIVIAEGGMLSESISGEIPFEISQFGWKRTVMQLQKLGNARVRLAGKTYAKTEMGHYIADVEFDSIFSPEDLEFQAKSIAGVLETGLFIGYADRVILHDDKKIEVKSRIQQK